MTVARIPATGRSMHPYVPSGATLVLGPVCRRPALGDLLAFLPDRGPDVCCHRVIAVDGRGRVLTRGDATGLADGWIEPARFVGIVAQYCVGGRLYAAAPPVRPSLYRRVRQRIECRASQARLAVARALRKQA